MFSIRTYEKDNDENFIYKTWLREKHKEYKWLPRQVFCKYYREVISRHCRNDNVYMITRDNDSTIICGFAAYKKSKQVIEYVKYAYRPLQVITELLERINENEEARKNSNCPSKRD